RLLCGGPAGPLGPRHLPHGVRAGGARRILHLADRVRHLFRDRRDLPGRTLHPAHPRPCERGHRGPGRGSFREEVARGDRQPGRARVLRAVPVCRRPMVVRGVRDRRDHGLPVAGAALAPLPVGPRRARRPVPATCRRGVASAHRACGTRRNGGSVGVRPLLIGLLVLVAALAVLATGLPIAFGMGAVALFFMLVFDGWTSVHYMTDTIFAGLDDFTLVSLPMFVLM